MKTSQLLAFASAASASSLSSICSSSYISSVLPTGVFKTDINFDAFSVTANAVYNYTSSGSVFYPDATFDYCNVTFSYSHSGSNDTVLVGYWLPSPTKFANRYLQTGGGAYAINSASMSAPGGLAQGAVAGYTDGGFGGFDVDFDDVFPLANGTANWPATYMFGYQAIWENTIIGKYLAEAVYNTTSKVYSYYQGCSEGGREGWSQVQRFADSFDGAVIGAPAFRYAFQQVNHVFSPLVEVLQDYYPPPCELDAIVNATITACDPLDGFTDGVIARSDLCKLHFNINSTIGTPYYCAASSGQSLGPITTSSTSAQNGTVSAKGVEVARLILDGAHDSEGKRIYLSFQPGLASFGDAATSYDDTTDSYTVSTSAEWITRFLELQDTDDLPSWDNVTMDSLRDWIYQGLQMYGDSLQTTWPDLTPFQKAGGKIIHFHGESDNSIPTASSVHYRESVRKTMYPELSFNESNAALNEWYKFYLAPGAAHCTTNDLQPNGPFPNKNLEVMIDWVENGREPTGLNATVLSGQYEGDEHLLCEWPLRPYWSGNSTTEFECVYDQASLDTWFYEFDSFKFPIY